MQFSTDIALLTFDLVGVFFFALSGNLLAARKDFDITGGLVLGYLAGLGGGVFRDLLLGLQPLALREPVYLLPPLLAAIVVYFAGHRADRARLPIIVCDAGGLALFTMTGTTTAINVGMNVPAAILMGVITAAGGGLLRDVVANEIPAVFNRSDLYIVPSLLGAALTALCKIVLWWNGWIAVLVVMVTFGLRMSAWWFGWRVPGQRRSWPLRRLDPRAAESVFRKRRD